MTIYNITYIIESTISNLWLKWVHHHFENRYLNSPFLKGYRWLKIIDSPNEGVTICLQLFFEDTDDLHQFQTLHTQQMGEDIWQKFNNQFVSYKSIMQEITV